jgi:hypothetical protein
VEDASTGHPFIGRWRIMTMALSDAPFLDRKVEAFIEFQRDRLGEFQFGKVHGWIDYRLTQRDGLEAVEYSWKGECQGDSVCGRGWAELVEGSRIIGEVYIHNGDDSSFLAHRWD